jgi:hypothetical protein
LRHDEDGFDARRDNLGKVHRKLIPRVHLTRVVVTWALYLLRSIVDVQLRVMVSAGLVRRTVPNTVLSVHASVTLSPPD